MTHVLGAVLVILVLHVPGHHHCSHHHRPHRHPAHSRLDCRHVDTMTTQWLCLKHHRGQ